MLQTIFAVILTLILFPAFIAIANIIFVEAPIDFVKKLSNRGNR